MKNNKGTSIQNNTEKQVYIKAALIAAGAFCIFILLLLLGDKSSYSSAGIKTYLIRAACAALLLALAADKSLIPPQTRSLVAYALTAAAPIAIAAGVMIIPDMRYYVWNMLLLYVIYIPILIVSGNSTRAINITAILAFIATFANELLMTVRGMPLLLADFTVLSTGATVASRYKYLPSLEVLNSIVITFALCTAAVACRFSFREFMGERKWLVKLGIAVLAATEILFAAGSVKVLKTQDIDIYKCGVLYNLAYGAAADRVTEPESYSKQNVEKNISDYTQNNTKSSTEPVNLIMIMDESFSDPTEEKAITTSEPIMPFYDSLSENTVKGRAVASVYGGGTSNSEFEFLTGMSMAFLPYGSYAYQNYLKCTVPTIVSDFSSDEYEKIYLHPYNGSNYNRDKAWKYLGFDKFEDISSFEDCETIRGYVSDRAAFDKLIENFNNKPSGKKSLQFMVTIQNHSPYNYSGDDFSANVKANEIDDEQLNQYLSLIKESDEAIEYLINYFKNVDERVAIVYFGDHRASIKALNDYGEKSENSEKRYEVPFFIWTNYPSQGKTSQTISINYLSLIVKQALGMELDPIDYIRADLINSYPIITKQLCLSADGRMTKPNEDIISKYKNICYYYLLDRR